MGDVIHSASVHVFDLVASHGEVAIFSLLMLGVAGLPVPDETLLVFCGYLISQGKMNPLTGWLAAVAGSWCGISLSYVIGRTAGLGVVHRFGRFLHITQQRLDSVHQWFDRIGHWALLVGYYIVGVRHFTAIVAGTSKLNFFSFMAYAWSGAVLWVSTFLTLGYFLGENWRQIAKLVEKYMVYVSVAVVIAALAYWVVFQRNRNRLRFK